MSRAKVKKTPANSEVAHLQKSYLLKLENLENKTKQNKP